MVSAGGIIQAGDAFGDWISFTPSFTNFTLGNGTRGGLYRRVGEFTIEIVAQFTFGSSSSISAGLGLTLPASLSGDGATTTQIVPAMAWDNSGAAGYSGHAKLQSGGGTALDRFFGPNTTQWNGTVPFTWATSDFLVVQGMVKVTT